MKCCKCGKKVLKVGVMKPTLDEDKILCLECFKKTKMTSKNKVYANKCPYCNEVVTFESEDQRADTDRGIFGRIVYWCPKCDADVTDDFDWTDKVL